MSPELVRACLNDAVTSMAAATGDERGLQQASALVEEGTLASEFHEFLAPAAYRVLRADASGAVAA